MISKSVAGCNKEDCIEQELSISERSMSITLRKRFLGSLRLCDVALVVDRSSSSNRSKKEQTYHTIKSAHVIALQGLFDAYNGCGGACKKC